MNEDDKYEDKMEEPRYVIPMDNLQEAQIPNINSQNSFNKISSKEELIDENRERAEGNFISRQIVSSRGIVYDFLKNNSVIFCLLLKTSINIVLIAYLVGVLLHWYNNGKKPLDWCRGNGMILILLIVIAWSIIYYKIITPFLFPLISNFCGTANNFSKITRKIIWIVKRITICLAIIGIAVFLILDTANSRRRLISASGVFVFIILGFIFSKHPNQIKWKTVLMGILVQTLFGLTVIRWEVGRTIFMCVGDRIENFLKFGYKGAAFVYGDFIVHHLSVFAFQALSVIYFLSTVIEILFYFGWLQVICYKLGWLAQIVLGTTVIESLNAVTTVFLGLSEAPLLYKPYVKDLTKSEMHAVMAGGLSTAAGSVFAAYASLGINPAYIITASIMAAPGALTFAKLLYPETEKSKTSVDSLVPYKSEESNVVDAACKGAISAVNIVMAVIAIVISCVSLVAFLDSSFIWVGSMIGIEDLSFEYLVGKLLTPIPYIMGVSPDQCSHVSRLIGIKITVNEFVAYKELVKLKDANLITPRSEAMATFALCSFSNPGGLASFIALLVSLCPSQKDVITSVAIRALVSGITTGLLTASIAGALMPEEGFGACTTCSTVTAVVTNATFPST
ncbi:putative transporter YutK isoform X2 [Lycorma delicatula]|uniref:putative transporter YutK isoform X2 n=1 Tax=Lycorma delicatula TaxID=130591 RepID=UPI003F5181F0